MEPSAKVWARCKETTSTAQPSGARKLELWLPPLSLKESGVELGGKAAGRFRWDKADTANCF